MNCFIGAVDFDKTDHKILALLQEDASLPLAEIAGKVVLFATHC